MITLILAHPGGSQQKLTKAVHDYLEVASPKLLYAGFAYATKKGADALLQGWSSQAWQKIDKRFIIGIHQGITEPQALRMLSAQANTQVRVYVPGGKVSEAALFSKPLFHPKSMLIRAGRAKDGDLLLVSSANLTGSAMGASPSNFECGQTTLLDYSRSAISHEYVAWWEKIWKASRGVDDKLISVYSSIRLNSFKKNPDLLRLTEPSDDIGSANWLWIEVGKASGIERHQVEFPVWLASFFGKPQKRRVDLTLARRNDVWPRPLSHKRTSYGVDIWRLGMPTVTMGGEPIQNRVIRFQRTAYPLRFEIEIADQGSDRAQKWGRDASAFGHIGRTGGSNSRQYGYA